jgi:hypothetical protein
MKLTFFDGVPLFCRQVRVGQQMSAEIVGPFETDEITAGTTWFGIRALAGI